MESFWCGMTSVIVPRVRCFLTPQFFFVSFYGFGELTQDGPHAFFQSSCKERLELDPQCRDVCSKLELLDVFSWTSNIPEVLGVRL